MKGLCIIVSLAVSITGALAQYGYTTNNPISSTINHFQGESLNSRLIYRVGLKRKGYTDAQLGQMTTEELKAAYLGGKVPGKKPAAKPAPAKPSGPPASQFKPSGKRIMMPKIVHSLTEDVEHRKVLIQLFGQQLDAYDTEAKKAGFPHDMAGAIAFFAGVTFHIQDGQPVNEEGVKMLARAIQISMDTPGVRKISDKEKQEFHEFMVTMGNYLVLAVNEVDEDTKAQLKQVASDVLKKFTGIDATKVKLTNSGLTKR